MEKTILDERYLIERKLGEDGLGEVYLARDHAGRDPLSPGRPVLVRLLHPNADHHARRRFEIEQAALGRIKHPYVAEVLGTGALGDGRPWFVTEYVEVVSLRDAMKSYVPGVPFDVVGQWLRQLGQALEAAHAFGTVHHDLRPETVMLVRTAEEKHQVKLVDFGMSAVDGAMLPAITHVSGAVETALYQSPEQIKGEPVTAASNIYTLGVIAYELLTGRLPFAASKGEKRRCYRLLEQREKEDFVRPEELNAAVPAGVGELVCQSLAYEPERRPASAGRFGEALEQLLVGETGAPPQAGTAPVLSPQASEYREPGGALGLESPLYIEREADHELMEALRRRDSIVLIEGGRQMGKTSLLARGLQKARRGIEDVGEGVRVVLTDFQKLSEAELASAETFFKALGVLLADALDIDADPETGWKERRGATVNFERFVRLDILGNVKERIVWGLDEVDRLFGRAYAGDVFGLFRLWHNERALEPECPWRRLTIMMSYATEAHLLIADMNQSPFNVGTRIRLRDFSFEQTAELNRRYGAPVDEKTLGLLYKLIGGHPYLTQKGLYEIARERYAPNELLARSDAEEGPFSEHLRRVWLSVRQEQALEEGVRMVLEGDGKKMAAEVFYRLRSGGVVVGETPELARMRCRLYERYLERRLTTRSGGWDVIY